MTQQTANARMSFGHATFATTLPIYARSEANRRDNRFVKAKRVKEQRGVAAIACRAAAGMVGLICRLAAKPSIVVTLTRIHKRSATPLDDDNLRSSLKAVRDGVADALGIDDGDKRINWQYGQEPAGDYAVRIEIQCEGTDRT